MKKPIGFLIYATLLSVPPLHAQNANGSTEDRQQQLLNMLLQQEQQTQPSQQQPQQAGQGPVQQVVQQLVQQALPPLQQQPQPQQQPHSQQQWQQQPQQVQQSQQEWQAQPQAQQAQQQWQSQQAQQPQQQWQAQPQQTQQQWQQQPQQQQWQQPQQQQAQQQWQQQPQQQQTQQQWQPQQQPQQQQPQWQAQQPTNGKVAPPNSEATLAAAISQFPVLPKGVKFERLRDGFSINGQPYVDAQGKISAYAYDMPSGDFTYVLETEPGYYVLKTARATTQVEPVTIANAQLGGGQWTVTTVTGMSFSGRRLIPSSRGFLVANGNKGLRYVAGKGGTGFATPLDFFIAPLQNGDAINTGYVLLERVPAPEGPSQVGNIVGGLIGAAKLIAPVVGATIPGGNLVLNGLQSAIGAGGGKSAEADVAAGLVGAAQALGSSMGIDKNDDYALFNISSGRMVPLNIRQESKQAEALNECRQKNAMTTKCARLESFDSVFVSGGKPNMEHYFWRIQWFNVPGRPILVAQEKGAKKVTATDLNSGKKVILFERMMGISDFAVTQEVDGKINATAKMGFSSESRQDVAALIDKLKNVAEDADI